MEEAAHRGRVFCLADFVADDAPNLGDVDAGHEVVDVVRVQGAGIDHADTNTDIGVGQEGGEPHPVGLQPLLIAWAQRGHRGIEPGSAGGAAHAVLA